MSVRNSSPIPGLGVAGGFKIMVEDRGGRGLETLQAQTDNLTRNLRRERGLTDVATGFRSLTPQLFLDIDRKKVESAGVSFQDLNQTLSMYLGSLYVNSFNRFGRHWQVTVQAEGDYRNRVEDINLLQVRNKFGQMVPLGTLVNVRDKGGPIAVTRYNLYTAAPITGNMRPGTSSGDAIEAVTKESSRHVAALDEGRVDRAHVLADPGWQEHDDLCVCIGNCFCVPGPGGIVRELVVAAGGHSGRADVPAFLGVSGCCCTGRDVNIFVQIGLVVLVGLACKNAILIVEFAKQKHQEGLPRFQAIQEACRLRLRPILMTSFAFIVGVIPLAVASGAGSEMRRSLGIAVFSGMLGVTLFGIFLTPVFFSVIQGLRKRGHFHTETTRWVGSAAISGLLGLAFGTLLAQLGVLRLSWALAICGPAGLLAALAILGISSERQDQSLKLPVRASQQHPESAATKGDPRP